MSKRAFDKISEGLQSAIDGQWHARFVVAGCRCTVTLADDAPGIWVGRVDGVPGFIVSGTSPFEAERKVRDHLPDFLATA